MTHDDVTAGRPRPNEDALRAIDFLLLDVDGVLTDGRVHFDFEGREYKSGQFPFMANGRALGMGASDGFVKMLADAKTELRDRKTIDRAKGLLMQRQGLTEQAAYEKLRKTAMDKGLKLVDVAQRMLDVMDLLG